MVHHTHPTYMSPPFFCHPSPLHINRWRIQPNPSPALMRQQPPCSLGWGDWGHSRSLAQLRAQQVLVNGAAQLLWVSNPRWVQLLKYSFSSSFKSNGELRDWEGGKFPNKQTLREGLSQARQWKEPDFKVPCKRGGCYHPISTRTWPQGSWEWRTRRVDFLHPQPVFQPQLV